MDFSGLSVTNSLVALLQGLATPYASDVLEAARAGKIHDIFPDVVTPRLPSAFAKDYLAYNLLRKVRDPVFGIKPVAEKQLVEEAVSGFLDVEAKGVLINSGKHPGWLTFEANTLAPEAVLFTAARKIRDLLGCFSLDEFASSVDFSNGASTRLPRRRGAASYKFSGKPHVTRNCAFLAMNLIWYHEPWRRYCQDRYGRDSDPCSWVHVVRGSEYFTVPKTATKLRGACKEPELNMFCQKAIGNMIRRRLRRVGIDLNNQSINQALALIGSRTGSLATMDLRNASDSVFLKLLELLPSDWERYIRMTRSEDVKLPDGSWHRLAKVSSMGNGFTFELESLIFWALGAACIDLLGVEDRRIGVYGDDIIVHHTVYPHLESVLSYCGFETNPDKSFSSGPFRESCGGHYYLGVDVTPFYLRTNLSLLEDKYHFLNSLNAWCFRFGLPARKHRYIHAQLLQRSEVVFVPPSLGTKCGLLAPSLSCVPNVFFCLRRQAYAFRVWASTRKSRRLSSAPAYLSWLLGSLHERLGEVMVAEEGVRKPRFKRAFLSEWGDSDVALPDVLVS